MPRRATAPDALPPSLDQNEMAGLLGYRLRRAQQAVFRDFAASVRDLSPGHTGMLMLVDANPGVTQSRLARAVGLDRSTMVGVLDLLETRGWVARRRGEDRRTNGLSLTSAGRAVLRRARRSIAAHEKRVARGLTPAERIVLLGLLEKLCAD